VHQTPGIKTISIRQLSKVTGALANRATKQVTTIQYPFCGVVKKIHSKASGSGQTDWVCWLTEPQNKEQDNKELHNMTREIREMTNQEAKEMIIRFKGVMANEFDISEHGINNFWHLVNQSMQLLQERIQENQQPDMNYG
jgi:hypothetical protein